MGNMASNQVRFYLYVLLDYLKVEFKSPENKNLDELP